MTSAVGSGVGYMMKGNSSVPSMRVRQRLLRGLAFDVLVFMLAYTAAISVRAAVTPWDIERSIAPTIFYALAMIVSLYLHSVYQRIWARTSGHGITVILMAVAVHTLFVVPPLLMIDPRPLPVSVIIIGNALAFGGFVAWRYQSRLIDGASWRWRAVMRREFPKARTRVLIIGAGESGQALAWRLKHRFPGNLYQVVGFIDDDRDKHDMFVEDSRVLGGRDQILRVAEAHQVDLIVVAMHNISGVSFREILALCEQTSAVIKVVPDLLALVNARSAVAMLRNVQPEDLIGRNIVTRHEDVDLSPLMKKRILITGAAGSIGSELSRQILSYEPTLVVLLDNNESGLHDLITELKTLAPQIEVVAALVDITIEYTLAQVFARHQPQLVFHAAAYKHVPMLEYYPTEALRVNIAGTRNVARMARDHGVERFVLISTDKAVNPSNIMGATKRICELMLQAFSLSEGNGTRYTSVRFGNVLGSRGSVVPTFNRQIDSGGPVTVTHPEMTRYFMSIPEAVNLIMHAACLTAGSEIFILRMGEVVRIVELAERMIRLRGLRPYKDIPIEFTGIRPGEKIHEELYSGAEQPDETLHPNIIQLRIGTPRLPVKPFWNALEKVTADLYNGNVPTLDGLRGIIAIANELPAALSSTPSLSVNGNGVHHEEKSA